MKKQYKRKAEAFISILTAVLLFMPIALAPSAALGSTMLTITLDGVSVSECNEIWTDSGVELSFVTTTNEDCVEGSCSYGLQPDHVWLYPARLNLDISGLADILTDVEVDIQDGCAVGCTRAFLYDGVSTVDSTSNSNVSVPETLYLSSGGASVDRIAVSSCEGAVIEIRLNMDACFPSEISPEGSCIQTWNPDDCCSDMCGVYSQAWWDRYCIDGPSELGPGACDLGSGWYVVNGYTGGGLICCDGTTQSGTICDRDNDGIADSTDNCPDNCNSDQWDADTDGIGDVCDPSPGCGNCGLACEHECSCYPLGGDWVDIPGFDYSLFVSCDGNVTGTIDLHTCDPNVWPIYGTYDQASRSFDLHADHPNPGVGCSLEWIEMTGTIDLNNDDHAVGEYQPSTWPTCCFYNEWTRVGPVP